MSDELAVLRDLISENPRQRIGELRIAMRVRTGESFTYPTLYRGVRDKPPKGLGYTHKKLTAKARQADAADEAFYLAALATEKDPSVFLFLDETGVSEKETQRRYGLGPPGKDIIVRDLFQERQHARGVRYTAILALNINGFVVPACSIRYHKHDEDDDDPDHGNMTGESFADYVANDLLPYLGNYEEGEKIRWYIWTIGVVITTHVLNPCLQRKARSSSELVPIAHTLQLLKKQLVNTKATFELTKSNSILTL